MIYSVDIRYGNTYTDVGRVRFFVQFAHADAKTKSLPI